MKDEINWDKAEEEHDEYLQELTGYPLKWRDTKKNREDKEKGETKHV